MKKWKDKANELKEVNENIKISREKCLVEIRFLNTEIEKKNNTINKLNEELKNRPVIDKIIYEDKIIYQDKPIYIIWSKWAFLAVVLILGIFSFTIYTSTSGYVEKQQERANIKAEEEYTTLYNSYQKDYATWSEEKNIAYEKYINKQDNYNSCLSGDRLSTDSCESDTESYTKAEEEYNLVLAAEPIAPKKL